MQFMWNRFWHTRKDADLERNRATFSKQQSPSFMSAFYDRAVRTNSYNEIAMKVDALTGQIRADNACSGLRSSVHTDRLLEPTQEAVDAFLQEQTGSELPEMMKMVIDFFDNSRLASTLCGVILQSIHRARGQCARMDKALADMPRSGEALGFTQQRLMAQGLSEMIAAENPFTSSEACEMFTDVGNRYNILNTEVEERRRVVGRKVKVLRRWRGGYIGIAVAMVAGATLVAVVVTTHVVISVAAAPVVVMAAAVARGQLQQNREGVSNVTGRGGVGRGLEMGARVQGNGAAMVERGYSRVDTAGPPAKGVEKGGVSTEMDAEGGLVRTEANVTVVRGGREGEAGGEVMESNSSTSDTTCSIADLARRGDRVVRWWSGTRGSECWCWGMAKLAGQSAKLDALARGSFLVNRMLDTLRCLVEGLQDDVDRNKRLVEFGYMYREEAVCIQQVGKQLFRSHMHLVRQLANLEEQVVVCFLLINKARGNVLQEFSAKA